MKAEKITPEQFFDDMCIEHGWKYDNPESRKFIYKCLTDFAEKEKAELKKERDKYKEMYNELRLP